MSGPFLELSQATVWRGADVSIPALRDLSLVLDEGESVAILGPNGSGKSTLLQLIAGSLRIENREGSVCRLFGEELWDIDELRHRIGLVMPEEVARFYPDELAFDVVLSVFRGAYGVVRGMRFSKAEREAASRAVDRMGVESLIDRGFGELSSGERRRFLIARALAQDPKILVLDEPTTALDFASAAGLQKELRGLLSEGRTLVWVTHHPGEILPEIDRVILLRDGRLFADGAKRKILTPARLRNLFGLPLKVSWSRGWCEVRA
ncbi:molybdenum ABC transporter ATP-binding protein [Haloferula helveola]|uniref:Molybdenum ABC transporter ATP-binding protein n=1 Tax=Haloferula helveola TaxID=490095 RepID=A0ABM7R8K9_9BACT|nr:molybdenum ABC transporter ATP-binding protein [Haloferula helveola]